MAYTYIGDLLRLRPEEGRTLVLRTFQRTGCNVSETARALGVGRPGLYKLAALHGIKPLFAEARAKYDAMRRL